MDRQPEHVARQRARLFFALGLLLTLATAYSYHRGLISSRLERFNTTADKITAQLQDKVLSYERGLRGTYSALLPLGITQATREHFHLIGSSRDLPREFPGALGMGFIERVPPGQRETFLAAAARQGRPNLEIRQIGDNPGDQFIVKYLEPEGDNSVAIGLDVASEDRRRLAIEQAVLSTNTTLTPPITLVQSSGKTDHGFLLLLPAYRKGQPGKTAEERKAANVGLVYMPLTIDQILANIDPAQDGISLTLSDASEEFPTTFFGPQRSPPPYPELVVERQLEVFGRIWRAQYRAQERYVAQHGVDHTATVVMIGTVIALLISALIYHELLSRLRLARSNERFQRLIASAPTALAMFDEDMVYLAASERWRSDFSRLSGQNIIGLSHLDLFPHLPSEWCNRFKRAQAGETLSQINECLIRKDGSQRWLNWAMAPWHNFDGSHGGIVVFAEDATEQRRLYRELEQAKDAAETANRAKTLFLGNMSHEMRTPLHQLGGVLALFQRSIRDEKQLRWLDMMRTSLRRLETVIGGILTLVDLESKSASLSLRPVDLGESTTSVVDMLRERAGEKGIRLNLTVPPLPPALLGDAGHIRTILACYINNAITFSDRGEITVLVDCLREDDHSAEIRFSVKDQGRGIPPEKMDRLFEQFEQVDNSHTWEFGGTGIGLAIVRKLARLMNGNAGCESTVGSGSHFWATVVMIKESSLPKAIEPEDFQI